MVGSCLRTLPPTPRGAFHPIVFASSRAALLRASLRRSPEDAPVPGGERGPAPQPPGL